MHFRLLLSSQIMNSDHEVILPFLADIDRAVSVGVTLPGPRRLTIKHRVPVGWVSTVPMVLAFEWQKERRKVNASPRRDAFALFAADKNQEAPQTHLVTIICELKKDGDRWTAVIHSVYPGKDVGQLIGDVSARESRVFLDFGNPGSETWVCDD